jgi:tRNA(fMet)-specific endonuclease VapC
MIGSRILLDTNIISAWLKGEKVIVDKIDESNEVYLPVQAVGELYYGAQYSTNVQFNIENITRLTSFYPVMNTNQQTALIYDNIKALLRKRGKPIPENDIWIAAIAQQYDLSLITRDRHFDEIKGLSVENW